MGPSKRHHDRDQVMTSWYKKLRFVGLNCTKLSSSRVLWMGSEMCVTFLPEGMGCLELSGSVDSILHLVNGFTISENLAPYVPLHRYHLKARLWVGKVMHC